MPPATPPLAANRALATRENQGNLAPVNNGGRFLSGPNPVDDGIIFWVCAFAYDLGTKSKKSKLMKTNPDGSLTIYVQNASPGPEKQLPSPKDNLSLYVRAYWPKEELTSGRWTPPLVKTVP